MFKAIHFLLLFNDNVNILKLLSLNFELEMKSKPVEVKSGVKIPASLK